MSKLSFRARALDPSKHMPIYLAEELPDLPEYSAINRAVPQMPSGMEKEEEAEHHLQRAICTGLIIPTPEVFTTEKEFYDKYYPANYKMPRQLIHMQPLGLEQDVPEYDMDSADEAWVNLQCKRIDLTPLKFEQMMDRLERSSGQTVVTLNEAKSLLRQDDELSIAVYDYWLNKRLKMQHPLILSVKTENRPGASSNNPYLAFRRRTEKMQTRKNRKNDETSYEKMLRLRRDLNRVTTLLEMVKQRELKKVDVLHITVETFERRVELKDYNNSIYSELCAQIKPQKTPFSPLFQYNSAGGAVVTGNMLGGTTTTGVLGINNNATGLLANNNNNNNNNLATVTGGTGVHMYAATASQYLNSSNLVDASGGSNGNRKEKRQYKKRKHKLPREQQQQHTHHHHQQQQQQPLKQKNQQTQYLAGVGMIPTTAAAAAGLASGVGGAAILPGHAHLKNFLRQSSSPAANESNMDTDEDDASGNKMGSESEDDAPFAFRRRANCDYQRPLAHAGNWPWEAAEDEQGCSPDSKYRFTLTSLRYPRPHCIGFARRRVGRGGRVLLDRASTSLDDLWSKLDYTILENDLPQHAPKVIRNEEKTVIDLQKINNNEIPATQENLKAVVDVVKTATNPANNNDEHNVAVSDDNDDVDDDDDEDEENVIDNMHYNEDVENVNTDMRYVSGISLRIQRGRHRKHRLSRRELREVAKRRRKEQQLALQHLARTLNERQLSIINNYMLNRKNKEHREDITRDGVTSEAEIVDVDTNATIIDDNDGDTAHGNIVIDAIEPKLPLMPYVNNHRTNNILGNINNNNKLNNKNSNSSSSNNNNNSGISNRQVNSSDILNVIKQEAQVSNEQLSTSSLAMQIKKEALNISVNSVADDSNEPLSCLKANLEQTAGIDVEDEEENVNLAQLSNLIKHTSNIKRNSMTIEEQSKQQRQQQQHENTTRDVAHFDRQFNWLSDDDDDNTLNQMEDVTRVHNLTRKRRKVKHNNNCNIDIDDMSSSPSSSQRLDVCNELLSEIRRDWLHFRPKTPTTVDDDNDMVDGVANDNLPQLMNVECKLPMWETQDDQLSQHPSFVEWSEQTPIAVEMLRLDTKAASEILYTTSPFKYVDLSADAQLLQPTLARSPDVHRSPETSNSSGGVDFNMSGDSLTGINLLDEDVPDELDNLLEGCPIDDIKPNFWNGFLDSNAVDVDEDVEKALLAGIVGTDKQKSQSSKNNNNRVRAQRKIRSPQSVPIGHSTFNVAPVRTHLPDEVFFKKQEQMTNVTAAPIKTDLVEALDQAEIITKVKMANDKKIMVSAGTTPVAMTTSITQPPPLATLHGATIAGNIVLNLPAHQQQQPQHQLANLTTTGTPMLITPTGKLTTISTTQRILQQQNNTTAQFINVAAAGGNVQIRRTSNNNNNSNNNGNNRLTLDGGNGNETIITLNSGNLVATTAAQQQQQQQQPQQHTLVQIQQSGQQTPQLRNVTMQQLQQLHQQQRQQQMLLQMQRADGNNTSLITQFVAANNNNSNNNTTTTMRQPTLTPIGANTTTGNHVMYTTTTGDGQKFFIQKAPISMAGGSGTTSGITLSNIKIEADGLDNNAAATTTGSGTGGGVVRSQLAIVDGQHQSVAVTGTPLLVATNATRNIQQQQSQQTQILQSSTTGGTQIVWRPINANTGGNTQNVLNVATTSQEGGGGGSMTVSGNKIVWTNRAAPNTGGNKRQLNGPETADLNKLFMNRKFSQRKVLSQQHQIQFNKQLQQLQQQQQQNQSNDESVSTSANVASNNNNSGITILDTTATNATTQLPQQQQQHHQPQQQQQTLQKVQMQGGKVIKMSTFPLFVSDFQQQQQQQPQQIQKQKNNNNVTNIGTGNHNYSLQPGTIITSQSTPGGGNKFYLTTASATAAGAAASGDLQPLVANATNSTGIPQKIHLKDLQNANLKVNFLSAAAAAAAGADSTTKTLTITSQQQQQLLQHHQQQQQQQQLQQQKRILNIIGATADGSGNIATVSAVPTDNVNSKRVLYTSLLNVKSLQKNNVATVGGSGAGGAGGQVHMQIGANNISHALLRGRIANNQTIFTTNMRSLPMSATNATTTTSTTQSNKNVNNNNNNNNNTVQIHVTNNNNNTVYNNSSNNVISSRTPTPTIMSIVSTPAAVASTTTMTPSSTSSSATITTTATSQQQTLNKEIDFANNENSSSNSSSSNNNNTNIVEKVMTTTTNDIVEHNAIVNDGIVKINNNNNNSSNTINCNNTASSTTVTTTTSNINR